MEAEGGMLMGEGVGVGVGEADGVGTLVREGREREKGGRMTALTSGYVPS